MNIENLIEKYQLNDSEARALRFMDQHKEGLKKLGFVKWLNKLLIQRQALSICPKKWDFLVIVNSFFHSSRQSSRQILT